MMKTTAMILILTATCHGLIACDIPHESRIKDEPFVIDNTYKQTKPAAAQAPGTIWRGASTTNTIFGDLRARAVGDIITVKIVEVSQASESATTDTKRTSQTTAGINNFLGLESNNFPSSINPSKFIDANTQNDFSGSGATTRTGSLSATITARVVDVLPSGNLAIEGKREIVVNNEKKEILLQGIVRQKDIAYDNSVLSTQIADAKVIYTGIGIVGEKQRPGFLARIFDMFWPF
ncbi:MAG TPA: flagellar basal body L-ring protein FlgH [Syntrophorhabdaceae bacterium]|nr:flagellar basal body L-ring protein FlgH [Syntrophorhabdaceae bacterium]